MPTANPYETLYQTEQLFRIPNERWGAASVGTDAPDMADAPVPTDALLSDLDDLLAKTIAPDADAVLVDTSDDALLVDDSEPVMLVSIVEAPPEPEPVTLVIEPEPLPKPTPRPTVPPVVAPAQQVQMPKLNHKVLLLADEELDPSNLLFLEKILNAVNLNIDGVDLLNLHGVREVDFADLVHEKKIHHFITFGVPFNRIHLDILMDRYQPVRFFGINFLMADSLPTIEADRVLKKRLWDALKQIFMPS